MQYKFSVRMFSEYISPDWSPVIQQSIVVHITSITGQHQISHGSHIEIEYGIKPVHMDFIRLVSMCGIMYCHMTTVEVCCVTCVCGHVRVEFFDVRCIFKIEGGTFIHPDPRTCS